MRLLLKLAVSLVLLASLLSLAGVYVERLDLIANFSPVFAAASLVLGLVLLALKERWSAALAGLLLVTNLLPVLFYPRAADVDGAAAAAKGGRLTVLTVNLWGTNSDLEKVEGLIARTRPDFVLLQELSPERSDLLTRLKPAYPWQRHCAHIRYCRLAILSKHPWTRAEARVAHPGRLPLARAEFGTELGNLLVLNAHLVRPYRASQRVQLATLGQSIGSWPGPVIVGGDFNAAPWSWTLRQFSDATDLRAAGPHLPSWPRRLMLAGRPVRFPMLQLQLDQVWLSGEATVIAAEQGADIGSDHMPLIVHLRLPGKHVLVSQAGPFRLGKTHSRRQARQPTTAILPVIPAKAGIHWPQQQIKEK